MLGSFTESLFSESLKFVFDTSVYSNTFHVIELIAFVLCFSGFITHKFVSALKEDVGGWLNKLILSGIFWVCLLTWTLQLSFSGKTFLGALGLSSFALLVIVSVESIQNGALKKKTLLLRSYALLYLAILAAVLVLWTPVRYSLRLSRAKDFLERRVVTEEILSSYESIRVGLRVLAFKGDVESFAFAPNYHHRFKGMFMDYVVPDTVIEFQSGETQIFHVSN